MPGQTNNQTILAAANQIVAAINDLRTSVQELNMNVTQINNCGCCDGQSTTTPPTSPPSDPGSGAPGSGGPNDPPGDGQEPPTGTPQQIASRRCKMATFLVDKYLTGVAQELDKWGIDSVINVAVATGAPVAASLTTGFIVTIISAVIGLVATPGPTPDDLFIAPLGGFIAGIVAFLIVRGGTVDFSALVEFLQDNRVELICALNSAQYAAGARAAFFRVVDNTSPNLDAGNRNFLDKMLTLPLLALLYYTDRKYQVLEGWLAEQSDDCPCGDIDPSTDTPADDYKCKAANYIFDSFTDTITNWGGVANSTWYSVASFIAALGAGLLSSMFSGLFSLVYSNLSGVIPSLISSLGRLYWRGSGWFEAFDLIAAEFEANKEAIICELYEAADVATARAALASHIADYVGNVMTAHPEWADEQQTYIDAVTSLLPNAVLNELFVSGANERPEIANYNPPDFSDCLCGQCENVTIDLSTYQILEQWEFQPGNVGYAVGATTVTMNGQNIHIQNPQAPEASSWLRWNVGNLPGPFTHINMPNIAGASNFYVSVFAETLNGNVFLWDSNGIAGNSYQSNFDFSPIGVLAIVVQVNNTLGQGIDWTIEGIELVCQPQI